MTEYYSRDFNRLRVAPEEELKRFKGAFPSYLAPHVENVFKKLHTQYDHSFNHFFRINVNDEELKIPYRTYYDEVECTGFSKLEMDIVNCYYSLNGNGFIREKYLRKIICLNEEWSIPFVIKLLGEYVMELLDIIYENLHNLDKYQYKKFITNNQYFYFITKQRMNSYYHSYYHTQYMQRKGIETKRITYYAKKYAPRPQRDYVGHKIVDYLYKNVIKPELIHSEHAITD